MSTKKTDLIIIGAGISGFTASIYASRYNLKNIVIGAEIGGQIMGAHAVENYPGFLKISGAELMVKCKEQAANLGGEIITGEATAIKKENDFFSVNLKGGDIYEAKSVILSMGMKYRELAIPGEKDFIGKGVSYCFTCDGMFFRDKIVAVVGGSDSACMAAEYLNDIAKKVYVIYRKDELRCEPIVKDKLKKDPKVEIIYNTNIIHIKGRGKVKSIGLDNPYKDSSELELDGIFVEIGSVPNFVIAKSLGLEMDNAGHIVTKDDQSTNIKGIYAAGDITTGSDKFRQLVTAASEGAIAAMNAYKFLKRK